MLGPPDEKGDAQFLTVSHSHPKPASVEHLREANDYIDKGGQSPFEPDRHGKPSLINLIPGVANQEHIKMKIDRNPQKIKPTKMIKLRKDSGMSIDLSSLFQIEQIFSTQPIFHCQMTQSELSSRLSTRRLSTRLS
jgi:hypothetical protein